MSSEKKQNIFSEKISNDSNKEKNLENVNENQRENIKKKEENIQEIKKENNNLTTENDVYNDTILNLECELLIFKNKYRDLKLRTQAEIENIRRRTAIDIEKAHKFSLEKFSIELLPVIDNLERAINISEKDNNKLNNVIFEGVELTLKSLLKVMHKFGVQVINEVNIPFNPDIHQAMSLIESQEITANNVLMIMQPGYTLHGRLLRPAMVVVSKGKNVEYENNEK